MDLIYNQQITRFANIDTAFKLNINHHNCLLDRKILFVMKNSCIRTLFIGTEFNIKI